jgi:predicted phosphodiesterase
VSEAEEDRATPDRPAAPAASDPTSPAPSPWPGRARVAGRWALRIGVALVGALIAVLLFARISAPIGPFDASLAFRPLGGGAELHIPPLGSLGVDVYDGPLRLDIQLERVDAERAQALATDPVRLAGVVDRVNEDLRSAVVRLVWTTAGFAVAGAALASLLLLRRRWEPLIAAGVTLAVLVGTAGLGVATWRPEAMTQPTYTGLLVNANSVIGSAEDILARFDAYRASLEDIVANVGQMYSTLSTLPAPTDSDTVALLHVSDLHLNPAGFDLVRQVVQNFDVDGVLDTGDITDWGSAPENQLIASVGDLDVPYVYIRGNHDSATTAALIAEQPNAAVLDDSAVTVGGLVVVGARDPRFTPDKSTGDDDAPVGDIVAAGEGLAEFVDTLDQPPAIALVHDPRSATPLDGVVPLVLAGHTHEREVSLLDDDETVLMVQGSTGGAGLRGLEGDYPEPLTCTVLYLDADTGELVAFDEITLGGLGETQVTVQRKVPPAPEDGDQEDSDQEDSDQEDDDQEDDGDGTVNPEDGEGAP